LTAEIERKFRVGDPPADVFSTPSDQIEQGYLVADGSVEIRLRRKGDLHLITVKKGHGEVRDETEVELEPGQFASLWPLTEGWRVSKRRHRIPLEEGLTAEMDVYSGPLEGLVTVEVEFGSEEESASFVPPDWFGEELTGDRRYSNQQMATEGLPPGDR
jgi:adenylate cyclase